MNGKSPFPPRCAQKYSHVRLLASGGFGSVHLAEQLDLGREVVIKLLRPDLESDDDPIKRFQDEAHTSASLRHENIVVTLDHDVEEGQAWIAFEYVPGRTLATMLEEVGSLSWSQTVDLGAQMAAALQEAHRRGIIHRDVKPENILEVRPGYFKIADFGLARAAGESIARTKAGQIVGSPTYMAPERLRENAKVGPSADIYSLAVVLYECATGLPPYAGTPMEVLRQHLESTPIPPRSRSPDLPASADRLIMAGLAPRAEDRYASAGHMKEALEKEKARLGEDSKAWRKLGKPSLDEGGAIPTLSGSRGGIRLERETHVLVDENQVPVNTNVISRMKATRVMEDHSTQTRTPADPGRSMAPVVLLILITSMLVASLWYTGAHDDPPPPEGIFASASPATLPAGDHARPADPAAILKEIESVASRTGGVDTDPATLPDLLPRYSEVLEKVGRDGGGSQQMLEIRQQITGIAVRCRELEARMRKDFSALGELADRLPALPDEGSVRIVTSGMSDDELVLLTRFRATWFIAFQRLKIFESYSTFFHELERSRSREDIDRLVRKRDSSLVSSGRQASSRFEQVLYLLKENLDRAARDPSVPQPHAGSWLRDLREIAHLFRYSGWHRAEGGALYVPTISTILSSFSSAATAARNQLFSETVVTTWESAYPNHLIPTQQSEALARLPRQLAKFRDQVEGSSPTMEPLLEDAARWARAAAGSE